MERHKLLLLITFGNGSSQGLRYAQSDILTTCLVVSHKTKHSSALLNNDATFKCLPKDFFFSEFLSSIHRNSFKQEKAQPSIDREVAEPISGASTQRGLESSDRRSKLLTHFTSHLKHMVIKRSSTQRSASCKIPLTATDKTKLP